MSSKKREVMFFTTLTIIDDSSFEGDFEMGQTLSEPVTAKDTTCVRSSAYRVGSSCKQDSHTHILSLPDDPEVAFFGVYDGHVGAKIAEHAGKNLHKYVINQDEYREGNIPEALKKSFLELDDEVLRTEQSGSTAVTVMIKDKMVYCANIGDSRAIASVNHRLEMLSWDHELYNIEYERITDAGEWVDCNRVNGNLTPSRAFGDYIFKKNSARPAEEQIVTAYPDVIEKPLSSEWDFIVLACDGIWKVMSDDDVLNYVTENIANGMEPEEICETLMMRCLAPDFQMAGLGCDNMTVVIVVFLHNGTYDDVVEKCKNYIQRDEEEISVNYVNDLIFTSSHQGADEGNNQEEEKETELRQKAAANIENLINKRRENFFKLRTY